VTTFVLKDSLPNEVEVTVVKLKALPRKSSKESQSDFDAIEVAETQQVNNFFIR
jgi:hypothetical protein